MPRRIAPPKEWDRDALMVAALSADATQGILFLDNSPYPPGGAQTPDGSNVATLWGYSLAATEEAEYSGAPTWRIQLPSGAGRGHGFAILPSGHMVVATSEDHTGNGRESWFLVPPGADGVLSQAECPRIRCEQLFAGTPFATSGGRHAIHWGDGVILLGSNGYWKPVTMDAWGMSDGELAALPGWRYDGNASLSGVGDYDFARQPGTDRLVIQGHDRVFALDLTLPTNDLSTTTHNSTTVSGGDGLDWLMLGDNVGRPANEAWEGFIAFDPAGNLAKQSAIRPGRLADIRFWTEATLATLPKLGNQGGVNPAPDWTMTCPLWDAMDLGVESVFVGLEFDAEGNLWTQSFSYGGGFPPGKGYRFSAAAVAAGGSQMPDRIINFPAESQASYTRMAFGRAAHVR